ncbi:hypothetical protein [Neobacillus vireti]|uniref:Uncharacterized protein n=1 Tax=Neobacillus vireti LMG 21834 TaxID=1131730 RepID=A0AB94IJ63_9BACI|nr:hypothetical protein [Neobacillus vireti]ETI67099.1 hypothetical protein BAVI_19329 [Neobacillus vireti LMG 21834]KLT19712.1 hypothetical protein AA980_03780 [Neobacillus vireti]
MDESKFYALCLQGNVTAAYKYLHSQSNKSKKHQQLASKYYQRFFGGKPIYRFKSNDPWIRKVILAYYQYFTSVLTGKNVDEAEPQLVKSLGVLSSDGNLTDNLDEIEGKLEEIFEKKGYRFLGGVTSPFRGPYIWKTMDKKEFKVEIPHQTQDVTVYFLRDFIMQSWIHFATFGEKFAGGWAKEDGFYYVDERPKKKSVNIESSEFQVSYLKHEAQHLSDYARFPNLPAKDLEYRAKLVELIYEPKSFRLLKKFLYEAKNDPKFPHPYSSFVLMTRLSKLAFEKEVIPSLDKWKSVDTVRIREWARTLYDEHTEALETSHKIIDGII